MFLYRLCNHLFPNDCRAALAILYDFGGEVSINVFCSFVTECYTSNRGFTSEDRWKINLPPQQPRRYIQKRVAQDVKSKDMMTQVNTRFGKRLCIHRRDILSSKMRLGKWTRDFLCDNSS